MSTCSRAILLCLLTAQLAWGWTPTAFPSSRATAKSMAKTSSALFSSNDDMDDVDKMERTSFDQAGASLIEEEDQKRMEQMGDFDSNSSVSTPYE